MRYIVSPYPYSGNIHLFSWSNIHSILTIKCKVWPFLPVSGSQEIITTHYSNIKKEYHLFCTFCTLCSSLPQTVRRLLPSTVRTHFLKSEQKPNMNRSWNILSRINVRKCILMYIWTRWMIYVRAKWYQNVPSRTDYKVGWEENTLYKNKMCRVTWLEPHLLISWLRRLFSLSSYMNFVFKPPVSFWLTASCSLWWAFVILLSRFILMLRLQVEDTTGPCASSLSSHPDACVLATQLIPAVSCLLQSKLTSVMCMV